MSHRHPNRPPTGRGQVQVAEQRDNFSYVQRIRAKVGHRLDYVELTLRNGTVRKYGSDKGGSWCRTFDLSPSEFIVSVSHFDKATPLGSAIEFKTSAGRTATFNGKYVQGTQRGYMAERGTHIVGLQFASGGDAGGQRLTGILVALSKEAASSTPAREECKHDSGWKHRSEMKMKCRACFDADGCQHAQFHGSSDWYWVTDEQCRRCGETRSRRLPYGGDSSNWNT